MTSDNRSDDEPISRHALASGSLRAWRGESKDGEYKNQSGVCKSSTLEDIKSSDYVLTPGRYVGAAPPDEGIPFETKMADLTATLYEQMVESNKLDLAIRKNLEVLG